MPRVVMRYNRRQTPFMIDKTPFLYMGTADGAIRQLKELDSWWAYSGCYGTEEPLYVEIDGQRVTFPAPCAIQTRIEKLIKRLS